MYTYIYIYTIVSQCPGMVSVKVRGCNQGQGSENMTCFPRFVLRGPISIHLGRKWLNCYLLRGSAKSFAGQVKSHEWKLPYAEASVTDGTKWGTTSKVRSIPPWLEHLRHGYTKCFPVAVRVNRTPKPSRRSTESWAGWSRAASVPRWSRDR